MAGYDLFNLLEQLGLLLLVGSDDLHDQAPPSLRCIGLFAQIVIAIIVSRNRVAVVGMSQKKARDIAADAQSVLRGQCGRLRTSKIVRGGALGELQMLHGP